MLRCALVVTCVVFELTIVLTDTDKCTLQWIPDRLETLPVQPKYITAYPADPGCVLILAF